MKTPADPVAPGRRSPLQRAAIALSALLLVVFVLGIALIPRWQGATATAPDTRATHKPCAPRVYPPESLQAGEQGIAWVAYTTAPDGTVTAARISSSSGHARLDAASLQHIRTCRFPSGGHSSTLIYKWVID